MTSFFDSSMDAAWDYFRDKTRKMNYENPYNTTFNYAKPPEPTAKREIDLDKLSWTDVYSKDDVFFCIYEHNPTVLVVTIKNYHQEEYLLLDLLNKVKVTNLQNTKLACREIFEYLINHAMFPYPVQEIY